MRLYLILLGAGSAATVASLASGGYVQAALLCAILALECLAASSEQRLKEREPTKFLAASGLTERELTRRGLGRRLLASLAGSCAGVGISFLAGEPSLLGALAGAVICAAISLVAAQTSVGERARRAPMLFVLSAISAASILAGNVIPSVALAVIFAGLTLLVRVRAVLEAKAREATLLRAHGFNEKQLKAAILRSIPVPILLGAALGTAISLVLGGL